MGSGAFGEVHMAIEPAKNANENDQTYAVKMVNKSKIPGFAAGKSLLSKEITALKGLYHPHIVQLKEVIDDPEAPLLYLVMQFLPGKSIQEKLDAVKSNELIAPIEQIHKWARQIVSALYEMHVK